MMQPVISDISGVGNEYWPGAEPTPYCVIYFPVAVKLEVRRLMREIGKRTHAAADDYEHQYIDERSGEEQVYGYSARYIAPVAQQEHPVQPVMAL